MNTTSFRVFFLFDCCQWPSTIVVAMNAWVGDLVCLCVMENRSCVERWMVEGAIALKKVCGMDGGR